MGRMSTLSILNPRPAHAVGTRFFSLTGKGKKMPYRTHVYIGCALDAFIATAVTYNFILALATIQYSATPPY